MDDSLQQSFVAENHCCAPSVGNTLWCEPLTDITGLDILRRGGYEGEMLWWLFLGVLIKHGLPLTLQSAEECLLHLLQEVEAHKDVGVVFEGDRFVLGHLTIEGSFVSQSLGSELLIEGVIDIANTTPQTEEPLFEFAVMIVGKVTEETLYEFALLVGEIRHVIKFVDVAQVGKDTVCRTHILVEVVEVGEQQLPPAIEMVECLVNACATGKALMEFADEQDGVGHLQFGMAARGTLVGEDDGDTGEVGAEAGEEVGGDVFEERHISVYSLKFIVYR